MARNSSANTERDRSGIVTLASRAILALGGLAVIAGIGIVAFIQLTAPASDEVRSAAEDSAGSAARIIDRIQGHLRHPEVLEQARQALAGDDAALGLLEEELNSRGVQNVIDLRVFPPRAEEIETGSYPDPDFGVIQMLVEARREGSAVAQIHYAGTPNENLVLAEAVPGAEHDEPVGMILLRVPAEFMTGQLVRPANRAWMRMVQGSREIALRPAGMEIPSRAASRVPVEGSDLAIEWGVSRGTGVLSFDGGLMVAGLGVVLALLGVGGQRVAARLAVMQRRREALAAREAAVSGGRDQAKAAQPRETSDAARPRTPETAPRVEEPMPPEQTEAEPDSSPDEPKPDLPDWLVDSGAGADAGDIFGGQGAGESGAGEVADNDQEREQPAEEDDLGLEVPDLDQILEQIDDEPEQDRAGTPPPEPDLDFTPSTRKEPEPDESQPAESGHDDEEPETLSLDTDDGEVESDEPSGSDSKADLESDSGLELGPVLELDSDDADETESAPEPDDEPASGEVGSELELETDSDATERLSKEGEDTRTDPEVEIDTGSGLFFSDEIRGVADETLDAETATRIGRAIATVAAQRGMTRFAVARDGRFSGPILLSALIRGLRNGGMDVVEVGAVPTPLLWFAAVELAGGCGVMVTGSHHPPEYNGFRIMLGGELVAGAQMAEIVGVFETGEFREGEGDYEQDDVAERYRARLLEDVKPARSLKVVVDCGHGIAGSIAPGLFEALGAEVIPLYCDVDGSFPNHPADPSRGENVEDLRLCVRNFQADIGIAFDGDGDRLAVVTDTSEIVSFDHLMMLLAKSALSGNRDGTVVFDVTASSKLAEVIAEAGGRGVMGPTGVGAIDRLRREQDAVLAGERDGHVLLADRWNGFDDALYAGARLLEVLSSDKRGVDESVKELPVFVYSSERAIVVDADRGRELIRRLSTEADWSEAALSTLDGLRVDYSDRWGLIRMDRDKRQPVMCFGADEASGISRIKSEFKDRMLAIDPDLPLPY